MNRKSRLIAAVLFVVQAIALDAYSGPTTVPARQPVEERAARELSEQLSKLDAEFRTKKADILRRHVARLTGIKDAAIRTGDRKEAQRLFDLISDTVKQITDLDPPSSLAYKPAMPFSLRVSDFDGAAGFTNVVNLTLTDVSVTVQDDFGHPPRILWQSKLTPPQQTRLTMFLRTFPLDQLENSYVDMNVFDGYQVFFLIQLGDRPPRKITVANKRQASLERLVDEVNQILPPKYLLSRMAN